MAIRKTFPGLAVLAVAALSATAVATPVPIDTTSAQNGVTEIYSVTFDGPVARCGPTSPPYCPFFQGGFPPRSPPAVRALAISPNPTTVINGIPDGITPVPVAGSYLDLTLGAGNASVTLAGGTITIPNLTVVIRGETVVHTSNAGIVFDAAPQTAPVDANGIAVFLVELAPAVAVDFSYFTSVVTSCSGSLCSVIPLLTLDMVRYRLLIDYDANFNTFTASYVGQTQNNSFLFATLNSEPRVVVTDSVAPAGDLQVPFGNVIQGSATATVRNNGNADLVIGQVALTDLPAAPFSLVDDNCSNQAVPPHGSCTFGIEFHPTGSGNFTNHAAIPSNDPDRSVVTLAVSGTGGLVGDITITDDVAPTNDSQVGFRNVFVSATADHIVTVTNDGAADLIIDQVSSLAAPFSFVTDQCLGQAIAPAGNCTITVRFAPDAVVAYSGTFDISSNDPDEPITKVLVNGTGGVPEVAPSPEGASSGFMALDPATLILLGAGGAWGARRRRRVGATSVAIRRRG